tara:strand:- start:579 stop:713 length:135 start_codon:yes stop_codon:yes gene_type:complete
MSNSGGDGIVVKPKKYDHLLKVIVIGDKSVGKSCCIRQYFEDKY